MDDLREHLQNEGKDTVSISSALNWLSEHAFGDQRKGPWTMATLYRWLITTVATSFPQVTRGDHLSDEQLLGALDVDAKYVAQMALLMVCTEGQAVRIIRRYPQVVDMDEHVLSRRLIGLKMALPHCDVGLLVELQPRLFLEGDQGATERVIRAADHALRSGLPGANITAMIEADPGILFEDVVSGIQSLLDLWPVEADTFANSDPAELALAVRALSSRGPPKRI